jgi:hypothetical protein
MPKKVTYGAKGATSVEIEGEKDLGFKVDKKAVEKNLKKIEFVNRSDPGFFKPQKEEKKPQKETKKETKKETPKP